MTNLSDRSHYYQARLQEYGNILHQNAKVFLHSLWDTTHSWAISLRQISISSIQPLLHHFQSYRQWQAHVMGQVNESVDELSTRLKSAFFRFWERSQPKLEKLTQFTVVATTTTSTFNLTIQALPILFTVLPFITSIPLIGILFPKFFFTDAILMSTMAGVSVLVGYYKYKQLIAEAEEKQELLDRLEANENRLNELEQHLSRLTSRPPTNAVTHQYANHQTARTSQNLTEQHTESALVTRNRRYSRTSH